MKFGKRILPILALGTCAMGIAAGAASCGAAKGDLSIGIMLYKDTGDDVAALNAYTSYITSELGIKFTFKTGSLTNQEANLNAIADLQLAGCQGIVVALCGDTFPSFVSKAAEGGTPIASYYGTPEDYYYTDGTAGLGRGIKSEADKKNMIDYYVGGIEDGVRSGDLGGKYLGEKFFEDAVILGGERNIELMHFNFLYYPKQAVACDTFIGKVNAWNADPKNAEDKIELYDVGKNEDGTYKTSADFPGNYPGDTTNSNKTGNVGFSLGFAPVDDTFFQKGNGRDGMTSIVCFGAAGTFIYPKAVTAAPNIRIYGSGYDGGSKGFTESFGTGIMRQSTFTCVESFAYPLAMLVNRIDGNDYADIWQQKAEDNKYLDKDVVDRRVSGNYNYVTTADQMKYMLSHSMYATHKASDALLKADDLKKLMKRYNSSATYSDLLKTVQGLDAFAGYTPAK